MRRVFLRTAGIALAYVVLSGHVGSPDTWFEGNAGPYRVIVQVETAGVIPGIARVFVRVAGGAEKVMIHANKFDATGAVPPPEPIEPVAGDQGAFAGKLWIMTGGSNSVTVDVSGSRGRGRVVVPVALVAYSRLAMNVPMGIGLSVVGLLLLSGLISIVGAAVREGVLVPGAQPDDRLRRRGRSAMAITTVVLAVALFGGWKWWGAEDAGYARSMYKPPRSSTAVVSSSGRRAIEISITDSAWIHRNDSAWLARNNAGRWTPLIEDHGKLMHVFAIRDDMGAFAHLHPATTDTVTFTAALPPLPPGRYRVFADIVHESGFPHTMVSSVDVTDGEPAVSGQSTSPDDAWFTGTASRGTVRSTLDDGTTVRWEGAGKPIATGKPGALAFTFTNPDGTSAALEPYMGMAGHAVVQRSDGSVFVHLHPMGTISVASKMTFEMRTPGDSIRGRLGKRMTEAAGSSMDHGATAVGKVSFPYAFPKAGEYRVWVQVKRGGRIMTAAFDATVADATPAAP